VWRFQKETRDVFQWDPDPRPRSAVADAADPIVIVEGPRGKAEIFEVLSEPGAPQYRVKFHDESETRSSMEDAYVTAGQLVGSVRR
jgi:hypothetical protein